jgi:integrase
MVLKAHELRLPPMNARTSNGYLSTMRAFCEFERKAGRLEKNPFSGKRATEIPQGESERGFTKVELSVILRSPLFVGAKSTSRIYTAGDVLIRDWHFWIIMIAMMTGARIAEISQLRPSDVQGSEGIWVLNIDDKDGKRLKNVSSKRLLPLHPHLPRLGLPQLAAHQRGLGHLTLLPGIPKPVGGDPGKQPGQWMTEQFLPRLGLTRKLLGFHSFGHAIRTLLREAKVDSATADRITGHSSSTVGDSYGNFTIPLLNDAISGIEFPSELTAISSRFPGPPPVPPGV